MPGALETPQPLLLARNFRRRSGWRSPHGGAPRAVFRGKLREPENLLSRRDQRPDAFYLRLQRT